MADNMEKLTKNILGQWSLEKGAVKESMVNCSGESCSKKVSKLTAIPMSNVVKGKDGKPVHLSPRKWLCDDCYKKQTAKPQADR